MRNIVMLAMVLVAPTIGAAVLNRLMGRAWVSSRFAARLGLALVLFFTGMAHFVQTEEMTLLLPGWVPARRGLILLSGVFEVVAGFGLLWERTARSTAAVLVGFFVLVFPANMWAAANYVPYGGHGMGPVYLLARGPLQVLFIVWSWEIARGAKYNRCRNVENAMSAKNRLVPQSQLSSPASKNYSPAARGLNQRTPENLPKSRSLECSSA